MNQLNPKEVIWFVSNEPVNVPSRIRVFSKTREVAQKESTLFGCYYRRFSTKRAALEQRRRQIQQTLDNWWKNYEGETAFWAYKEDGQPTHLPSWAHHYGYKFVRDPNNQYLVLVKLAE